LLEKQEDILYEEHDKFINVQKSLALETKKNELLSSELSSCQDSISNIKSLNADLNAKLEKVNVASSNVEHVFVIGVKILILMLAMHMLLLFLS
jgi:septal ring factor EnvC (AmiA/AmiB activator)